jgi:hypothetical protein
MHRKRRSNKNWVRLLKQVKESNREYIEFGVKRVRPKTHYNVLKEGIWWDYPYSSKPQRSWKSFRNTQYKAKRNEFKNLWTMSVICENKKFQR